MGYEKQTNFPGNHILAYNDQTNQSIYYRSVRKEKEHPLYFFAKHEPKIYLFIIGNIKTWKPEKIHNNSHDNNNKQIKTRKNVEITMLCKYFYYLPDQSLSNYLYFFTNLIISTQEALTYI